MEVIGCIMRRDKIDIIIDILEISKVEITKTSIIHKANLNFKLADRYLQLLQKHGLIENRLNKYTITKNGKQFLKEANDMTLIYSFPLSKQSERHTERRSQLTETVLHEY